MATRALLGGLGDSAGELADSHAALHANAAQNALDWVSAQHDSALAKAFDVTDPATLVHAHAGAARAVLRAWVQDAAQCDADSSLAGPDSSTRAPAAKEDGTTRPSPLPDTTRAAQAVLALLAARVPGCALASPAWLRANLLASSAQLQFSDERGTLDVRLTRAPLHVLLLVAGLTSCRWPAPVGPGAAAWQVNISTEDLA